MYISDCSLSPQMHTPSSGTCWVVGHWASQGLLGPPIQIPEERNGPAISFYTGQTLLSSLSNEMNLLGGQPRLSLLPSIQIELFSCEFVLYTWREIEYLDEKLSQTQHLTYWSNNKFVGHARHLGHYLHCLQDGTSTEKAHLSGLGIFFSPDFPTWNASCGP